jgi:hypothetical protein
MADFDGDKANNTLEGSSALLTTLVTWCVRACVCACGWVVWVVAC